MLTVLLTDQACTITPGALASRILPSSAATAFWTRLKSLKASWANIHNTTPVVLEEAPGPYASNSSSLDSTSSANLRDRHFRL